MWGRRAAWSPLWWWPHLNGHLLQAVPTITDPWCYYVIIFMRPVPVALSSAALCRLLWPNGARSAHLVCIGVEQEYWVDCWHFRPCIYVHPSPQTRSLIMGGHSLNFNFGQTAADGATRWIDRRCEVNLHIQMHTNIQWIHNLHDVCRLKKLPCPARRRRRPSTHNLRACLCLFYLALVKC